ncbi:MAG: hypothetical protein HUU10_08425 [Bacteroidetes bacterium]|nr:hypothetical protein [Bacteroidota bacterium]
MNKINGLFSLVVLIGFAGTGCSSLDEQWGKQFTREQKIAVSMERAGKRFAEGKQKLDAGLIRQATEEWKWIFENLGHDAARLKLVEANEFVESYRTERLELAVKAREKKNIFTAAGYYKQVLLLEPGNAEAKAFLDSNSTEIQKRLQTNLDLARKSAASGDQVAAKRSYNRVLAFDPTNEQALKGLASLQRPVSKPVKSEDKEALYRKGVEAYEKKDYMKAYELLSNLEDMGYKDTTLYLQRSSDKIQALGLDETGN